MKEEEIKNHIDFKKIGIFTHLNEFTGKEINKDYLLNDKGDYIYPLNPVEFKLIEKIEELEARIAELESKVP